MRTESASVGAANLPYSASGPGVLQPGNIPLQVNRAGTGVYELYAPGYQFLGGTATSTGLQILALDTAGPAGSLCRVRAFNTAGAAIDGPFNVQLTLRKR